MPESDTIQQYSLYYNWHYSCASWHYSLYYTDNTHTTQKHTETIPQSTYTNSTTLEIHTHTHTPKH